jgi:hypothetical protein
LLDARDLHQLMERNPDLAKRIEQVVRERTEFSGQTKGDLLAWEMESGQPES